MDCESMRKSCENATVVVGTLLCPDRERCQQDVDVSESPFSPQSIVRDQPEEMVEALEAGTDDCVTRHNT